jgi:predicted PurR-regulated permease PerM
MPLGRKRAPGLTPIPVREPFVLVAQHPQIVTAICLTILSVIAICAALVIASSFLMPIAVALVFSVILAPICGRIEWLRIPRPKAALFTLILAGALVWVAFSLIAQPASR